jgi:hypothetical protein
MNPRPLWLTVAFIVCASVIARSQPNHLVPVRHETGESAEYRRLIYKYLLVTPAQFGRMIYEPGWYEPEWAESVYGTGATNRANQPYDSYRVTVTRSRSSIWNILEERKHEAIRTSRKDALISKELALAVRSAWRTMLSRTRMEEERYIFMDAPTVEFTLGSQRGEITPLRKGLTDEMFEIGLALAQLCEMPADQRRLTKFERSDHTT